jgi:hypothetical protein
MVKEHQIEFNKFSLTKVESGKGILLNRNPRREKRG